MAEGRTMNSLNGEKLEEGERSGEISGSELLS